MVRASVGQTPELSPTALARRYERALRKVAELESIIEDSTRSLFLAHEELRRKNTFLESILSSMDGLVIVTDREGVIMSASGAPSGPLCITEDDVVGRPIHEVVKLELSIDDLWAAVAEDDDVELIRPDGTAVPVLFTASGLSDDDGEPIGVVCLATDLSERKRAELARRHAQRLESVGHLAAGVAHEINTPIQFIGDNVHFLGEAMNDLVNLIDQQRTALAAAPGTYEPPNKTELADAEECADLDFLRSEAPLAVERTVDGVGRVAQIVSAMKQFSHPGVVELGPEDVNDIVSSVLTMSKSEYKYVAEVVCDLGEAIAWCNRGELSQVVLNLVVNAAQAISEKVRAGAEQGTITVTTGIENEWTRLDIADTGGGVPADIQDRIFDPFFTTKDVGEGTGQGLAIAHHIVVDKHHGRISLAVDEGRSSTFSVWLPRTRPTT